MHPIAVGYLYLIVMSFNRVFVSRVIPGTIIFIFCAIFYNNGWITVIALAYFNFSNSVL